MVNAMSVKATSYNVVFLRKACLVFCWSLGLYVGYLLSLQMLNEELDCFHSTIIDHISIVGLLLTLFFPLFLSAFCVHYSVPLILLPIVFIKSLCFSYCACCIYRAFGDAGWLMRWLYFFSDSCMLIIMLRYWLKFITGNKEGHGSQVIICSLYAVFIGCIDYFILSPILIMLLNH